jgi:predicted Zn-dependent protease
VQPGELPVVFEPAAVGELLDLLGRCAFNGLLHAEGQGALTGRLGTRVAAPAINLSDSPRFPGTLPRSYDAEGMPRQPVPLVQDGVAHRLVRDCASPGGPSTGHATIPLRAAPAAQHLVLVGGGAADEQELISQVERGIYVPDLSPDGRRLMGAFAIQDGRRSAPLLDAAVEIDGMAVLAWVQALTMGQQLVASDDPSARTIGASMCPALRALGGVRVAG